MGSVKTHVINVEDTSYSFLFCPLRHHSCLDSHPPVFDLAMLSHRRQWDVRCRVVMKEGVVKLLRHLSDFLIQSKIS